MKVLISLDERLLRRIDLAAKQIGLSRSAYIARLARRDLEKHPGPGATSRGRGAIDRLERLFASQPGGQESAAAIRTARDARARRG